MSTTKEKELLVFEKKHEVQYFRPLKNGELELVKTVKKKNEGPRKFRLKMIPLEMHKKYHLERMDYTIRSNSKDDERGTDKKYKFWQCNVAGIKGRERDSNLESVLEVDDETAERLANHPKFEEVL